MDDVRREQQQKQAAATPQEQPLPVPRKIRGTLTIKAEDDMEFRAQRSSGISSQQEISHTREAKLYRTVGEKKNTIVAHISMPADTQDRRAYLYEQVDKLTADEPTKARPKLKGRRLLSDEEVTVTTCEKEGRVQVVLDIDVARYPDYTSRLLTLMQRVNQCFATNQISLARLRR